MNKNIFLIKVFLLSVLSGNLNASEPNPWQLGLQPPAGSVAVMANSLHNLLLIIITAISVFVLGLLIYVCWKFSATKNKIPTKTTHNPLLEFLWTVIPVVILVVIAIPSFQLLYYLDKQIDPDMTIKVTSNQWYWNYEYPDENIAYDSYMIPENEIQPGQKRLLEVDNPLVVPVGSKIKVLLSGNDVMHSFFVPSLAVQEYAFPGQLNEVWMDVPEEEKTYYGQCNQICGKFHSYMPIVVKAIPLDEYNNWLIKAKQEFAKNDFIMNNNFKLAEYK